jgi:hypothetical protein
MHVPATRRWFPRLVAVLGAIAVTACSAEPVTWDAPVIRAGDALHGRLVLDGVEPRFIGDTAALRAPDITGACQGSARVAVSGASGVERYVAWWAPRADSSAALLAARSTDGGVSWTAPEPVDTADHHPLGCSRPAPAIAADSSSGYVHVAYSMRDAQGAGVFFSHSMDHGKLFHSPVTIMYGDQLTDVAIAAHRDTVAVAFIDPSSDHPELGLALSHTMGHIFEQRLTVPSSTDASTPRIAIAPGRIAVAWIHHVPDGASSTVIRVGRFGAPAR